ncbi:hypothetical protein [Humidisolicoccus flavus]|uniref:hypothetical protein n=1 Tax=Humidisolicoccus flavus TaxID=3111414 RepID=UPI00324B95FC
METNESNSKPSKVEAQQALALADAEESATRFRPVPVWYYPVLALLVLGLFVLNGLEQQSEPVRITLNVLTLLTALAVAFLVGRVSFGPSPYRGVRVSWAPMIASGIVAAGLALSPVLLADTLGSWIWIVCGLALSALIAGFGIAYWRRTRRG